jgi:hypothetical protein
MSVLGVRMRLLFGEDLRPATERVMEALRSAGVNLTDQGPIGFQMTFDVGRSGRADLLDYKLLEATELRPFNRVVLTVSFALREEVLVDGYITDQQLNPGNEPGTSTLTLTGEDVSVMMDLEEKAYSYPNLSYKKIVGKVVDRYKQFFPTSLLKVEEAQETLPNQDRGTEHQPANYTDREYVQELARRNGYVFYVTPGPEAGSNGVYWGPPRREKPQKALSANMGPNTNVESIDFRFNALAPNKVASKNEEGEDKTLDKPSDVRAPLAKNPAATQRTVFFSETGNLDREPVSARVQAMVDRSLDEVVTATGELDAVRYGGLLRPRGIVELRGLGHTYSGAYYVKSVRHSIQKGEYKQRFTLTREGTGALSQQVQG